MKKLYRQRWDKPASQESRYVIYRDKANGMIEHYTHCDGDRVFLARAYAENEVCQGRARYVDLWKAAS